MTASPTIELETPRRKLIRRIITTLVMIGCGVLLVIAAQRTERGDKDEPTFTGDDEVVRQVAPIDGSSVLAQAQVLIEFDVKYSATLSIEGVAVPDSQLQRSPERGVVSFTPGPGKIFERLPQGRVCASAQLFRIDGVQEDPRTRTWCFNVT